MGLLRTAFRLLPVNLKNELWVIRNKKSKNAIIKKWELNGKPLPTPHAVKQLAIEYYKNKHSIEVMVETGTYLGEMVLAQKDNFKKIYSIELGMDLWKNAEKKFQKYAHIKILQGDSGKVLREIVTKLDRKTIFWLDGHYSGGITAKGDKNCPVYEELDAIFNNNKWGHVLLIDDAREFKGVGDYPKLEELESYIKSKNASYQIEVKDDIIRCEVG
ncbi:MAG TPA: hypothetical protein VNT20_10285 [Flavisolibacter sp.]|jgi:hypothetical protein|nr:hypothetical protein [Flavisolibacter sp.]